MKMNIECIIIVSAGLFLIFRMMQVSETNVAGRVNAATLLKVFEETGSVVCTRYCNYTSSDQSLRTVSRVRTTPSYM